MSKEDLSKSSGILPPETKMPLSADATRFAKRFSAMNLLAQWKGSTFPRIPRASWISPIFPQVRLDEKCGVDYNTILETPGFHGYHPSEWGMRPDTHRNPKISVAIGSYYETKETDLLRIALATFVPDDFGRPIDIVLTLKSNPQLTQESLEKARKNPYFGLMLFHAVLPNFISGSIDSAIQRTFLELPWEVQQNYFGKYGVIIRAPQTAVIADTTGQSMSTTTLEIPKNIVPLVRMV